MKKTTQKTIGLVLALLLLLGAFTPALAFGDVRPAQWHFHYIEAANEHGFMTGVGNDQFHPDAPFTRAQAVATLYRLAGSPQVEFEAVFSDVPATAPSWYRDAVIWASQREIVVGNAGRFSPDAPITRESFAAILSRFASYFDYDVAQGDFGLDLIPTRFTDRTSIGTWAQEYMAWAFSHGLITGVSDTRLAPQGTATRAQAATILIRFGVLTDCWDAPTRPVNTFPDTIAATMEAVPALMEVLSVPGATVAFVDAQTGFTWTQGFGYADIHTNLPVTENTVFPVASISKTFTAVAVMQLVEAGRVNLDNPIVYYLPDFSIATSPYGGDYRNITVRMLLSHTSGIVPGMLGYGITTTEEYKGWFNNLLDNLADYAMVSPEDVVFTYANNGFELLGVLVAELTGNNNFYDDFVAYTQANIFSPLGMSRSSFAPTATTRQYLARPHLNATTADEFLYFNFMATGGLLSTGADMARFMHAILTDGGDILSAASTRQILEVHDFDFSTSIGGMRYGLGTMRRTTGSGFETVGHGGNLAHYHSDMVFDLDSGIGVFVSFNSVTALPLAGALAADLLELAVEEKTGSVTRQAPRANPNATPISLPESQLEAFVGLYAGPMEYYLITLEDGVLHFALPTLPGFPAQVLTPLSDGSFASELLGRVWFNPMTMFGEEAIAISLGNLGTAPIAFRADPDAFIATEAFVNEWTGTFAPVNEGIFRSSVLQMTLGVDEFGFATLNSTSIHVNPFAPIGAADQNWAEDTGFRQITRNAQGQVTSFVFSGLQFVRV